MSKQHRATPEQWAKCESDAAVWSGSFKCILELRDRLAAAEQRISELEGNSSVNHPELPDSSAPAGSLMAVVAAAIADDGCAVDVWHDISRTAILAVAEWLDSVGNNGSARELRQEVERHG